MSSYTPHENYQPHETAFRAIRAQGHNVAGLDACRALIRQCRLVRYGRYLELQAVQLASKQMDAPREEAAKHEGRAPVSIQDADPDTLTPAEVLAIGSVSPDAPSQAAA